MSIQGKIVQRQTLRPAPEIHIEEDGSFGAIVTPWGPRASVHRIIGTLTDFILSAKNDMEALTSRV